MKQLIASLYKIIILILLFYLIEDKYQVVDWVKNNTIMYERTKEEEFVKQLREQLLEGEENFTLTYVGNIDLDYFTNKLIDKVYEIDELDTSSDYDYLRYNIKSIHTSVKGFGNNLTIDYKIVYNESKQQTMALDQEIDKIFKEWNIHELSDYTIVKKIHDFIINNASYDKTLTKYSAYANYFDQSSTCQGYASLAYKMLTKAGIPSRIITGLADGQNHGWNIVRLNGRWYNLDLTWDDPLTLDGTDVLVYDYFLKSEEEFLDHIRDEEFTSTKFYSEYPMGDLTLSSKLWDNFD